MVQKQQQRPCGGKATNDHQREGPAGCDHSNDERMEEENEDGSPPRSSRRRVPRKDYSIADTDDEEAGDDNDDDDVMEEGDEQEENLDDDGDDDNEMQVDTAVNYSKRKKPMTTAAAVGGGRERPSRASKRPPNRFQPEFTKSKINRKDAAAVVSSSLSLVATTAAPKSPARRHHQRRHSLGDADASSSSASSILSDNNDSDDYDDDNEEPRRKKKSNKKNKQDDNDEYDDEPLEPLKVLRILARRTETRSKWREITKAMNTSEIHYGSRWIQETQDEEEEGDTRTTVVVDDTLEERFLVKWSDLSYLHCSWETRRDLLDQTENVATRLSAFERKAHDGMVLFSPDERCDGDYYDPGFCQVDRIVEVFDADKDYGMIFDKEDPNFDDGTGRQFLVKWVNLAYTECTYEFERDLVLNEIEYTTAVDSFFRRNEKPSKSAFKAHLERGEKEYRRLYKFLGDKTKLSNDARATAVAQYQTDLQERVYKNGGQLRDYQAEGVSWFVSNYVNRRSCILADEMGLGKTLQTAAMIDIILNNLNRGAPALIIAPLSTLAHWQREFHSWTDLNVVVYHGTADDRRVIREREFVYESDRPDSIGLNQLYLKKCATRAAKGTIPWMVNVVITSPEIMICDDAVELASVNWEVLIVDEAHRLKNYKSKLAMSLRDTKFTFRHRVLLTGTPIQNDVQEFWTILNFVDPDSFGDMDDFNKKYDKEHMKSKQRVDELHEEIRPYILRRLKEDVEKSVPPKEETLIEVELTNTQKQYYRALYEKNVKFLHKNKRALDGPSLSNLAMQLRKCCNHLFLLNGVEEELRRKEKMTSEGDFLAKSSGKLVLLDKLLPRLKEQGHRVLVFSQFKIMLDILEDYFVARETKYERIDGSITGNKRQQAIDRFQAPSVDDKEAPFVMMLSTRAGGVGINLTAADTVIIFDSDWNPQNDLQAQARCHRIGQTKSVKIYRLLTRKTYEMQMFHMSSLKMGLDKAVLNGFENGSSGDGSLSKDEIEKLLRHGAYDIFNEEKTGEGEKASNDFIEQDIDSILERRSRVVVHDNTGSGSAAAGGTFSKASFKAKSQDPNSNGAEDDVDVDDPDFWKKFLKYVPEEDEEEELNQGRRNRNQTNYSERSYKTNLERDLMDAEAEDEDDDASVETVALEIDGVRLPWGGSADHDWRRADVEAVVKHLCTFGYCDSLAPERLDALHLEEKHSVREIKRMMWSIILLTLDECVKDDAGKMIQVEAKNNEKLECSEGVLVSAKKPTAEENDVAEEKCLRKHLDGVVWLQKVLADATLYAQQSKPRDPKVTSLVGLDVDDPRIQAIAQSSTKSQTDKDNEDSIFSSDLWPLLKAKGWGTMDTGSNPRFVLGEKQASRDEMLEEAQNTYPDLKEKIEAIRKAPIVASKQHVESLSPETVKLDDLLAFVSSYGSIQLTFNNIDPSSRVTLTKKVLSNSLYMYNASQLFQRCSIPGADNAAVIKNLARIIAVGRRVSLPHTQWTSHHDATLVFAIVKHGFIGEDAAAKITGNDKSLPWDNPFQRNGEGSNSMKPSIAKHLLSTSGKHAASILNDHRAFLENVKGFNSEHIVKTYGLVRSTHNAELWVYHDAEETSRDDVSDLPPKKDLVRRAKAILCRVADMNASESHGLVILDPYITAHGLLGEILRAVLREINSAPRVARQLVDLALKEIGGLEQTCASQPSSTDVQDMRTMYQKIIEQLDFAKRHMTKSKGQAKNIVRVTLGEEPLKSRKGESTLPVISSAIKAPAMAAKAKPASPPQRISSKTLGEKAIEAARRKLFETFGANPKPRSDAFLYLTEVETLIVTIVISSGLPVWDDLLSVEPSSPNSRNFSWCDFYRLLNELATKRVDDYKKRVNRIHKELKDCTTLGGAVSAAGTDRRTLQLQYDCAKDEFSSSVSALEQVQEYEVELDNLAKKTIMLLAKVHQVMEVPAKGKTTPMDGVGSEVVAWMRSEVRRWAVSFELLGDDGKPLAYTAVEFLNEVPEDQRMTIEVSAVFDGKNCFYIAAQSASSTRIRSLLLAQPDVGILRHHLDDGNSKESIWNKKPSGWTSIFDVTLLWRLSTVGYGPLLMSTDLSYDTPPSSSPSSIAVPAFATMKGLHKGHLQYRADMLVRELHSKCQAWQERSGQKKVAGKDADMIALVDDDSQKKRKSSVAAAPTPIDDEGVTHAFQQKKICVP